MVLDVAVKVYNVIPGSGELSLEEFVHFDNNTVVAGTLTDEECNNDNVIENVPTVTKKSSAVSFGAYEVLYLQQRSDTGHNTFTALVKLENKINFMRRKTLPKKKLPNISKNSPIVLHYLSKAVFLYQSLLRV